MVRAATRTDSRSSCCWVSNEPSFGVDRLTSSHDFVSSRTWLDACEARSLVRAIALFSSMTTRHRTRSWYRVAGWRVIDRRAVRDVKIQLKHYFLFDEGERQPCRKLREAVVVALDARVYLNPNGRDSRWCASHLWYSVRRSKVRR
jgi:hypothetical protein